MDILLFGGLLLDRYFTIDRWPQRGQDGFFENEENFVGGCAINMAVTIRNLGGQAHVVSALGSDAVARTIRDYLDAQGLSQALVHPAEGDTGSCLVFVERGGERTFLTRRGVEEDFTAALGDKCRAFRPAWAGLTGYYLLGQDAPAVLDCLEALHAKGTKVLFDPSPLVGSICPDLLARAVALSDLLTPNDTELSTLGGRAAIPADKTLIVKHGAAGGTVYAPDETFDYPCVPCESVDTTGAGDSFSGALLYALSAGQDLRRAVALAAKCAARTCAVHGPHGTWKLEESI